jgi:hypothetical protein
LREVVDADMALSKMGTPADGKANIVQGGFYPWFSSGATEEKVVQQLG